MAGEGRAVRAERGASLKARAASRFWSVGGEAR